MVGRGKDNEANAADELRLHPGNGSIAQEIAHVGGAAADVGDDFLLEGDPNGHANVAVLAGEAGQRVAHDGIGKGALAHDGESSSAMLAIVSAFFALGSTRQHGAGMNEKLAAAFVECRPATGLAHEERTGELPFEVLDMAADGRLRDAELPGGRREAAC